MTYKVLANAPAYQERIRRNVKVLPCGCWEWQGTTSKSRHAEYPRISVRLDGPNPTKLYAHRVSLEAFTGQELADGEEADHKCFNTLCVNPAHLEAVTGIENKRRARNRSSASKVH